MDTRVHHVGIRCGDIEASEAVFRRHLDLVRRNGIAGSTASFPLLGSGTDVSLELLDAPILGGAGPSPGKPGSGRSTGHSTIDHLGLAVRSVPAAVEELSAAGLAIARPPARDIDAAGRSSAVVLDPHGLPIELVEAPVEASNAWVDRSSGSGLRFHHVSLITPDLRVTQAFYAELLGFRTLFEQTRGGDGFLFMVDGAFDLDRHNVMVEMIGPPYLEPREARILRERGACYDHYGFVVDDLAQAYDEIAGRGALARIPPHRDYGRWIAWLEDADSNDVELMSPISDKVLRSALDHEIDAGHFVLDLGSSTEVENGRLLRE